MTYKIGIDVGGSFTDLVVTNDSSEINLFKAPSTPSAPAVGVQNLLKEAAHVYKKSLKEFLGETESIVHGTTISTNSVIQHKAAKIGLLVTKGFRHILYYREGGKKDVFNLHMEHIEPYVPIYLTLPVDERMNCEGEVEIPLNEDSARQAICQLKKYGVEAIGVCFLWSIANPAHENRVGEIIEEEFPGIPYSLSHIVQPVIKEFTRCSSTAIDASLKPVVSEYCRALQEWLSENGFMHELLLIVATGGAMSITECVERPVYVVFSGPTVAPVAGLLYGTERGFNSIINVDMGGTSFDVSAIVEGTALMTGMASVGDFPTGVNSVEINSIGAGGGSIAWVDKGGLLHVGPISAGASPGPACYATGGDAPTVTDADIVLGYLNPNYFLGGKMKIDSTLSYKAIEEKVAKPLKIGVVEAAASISKVVNQDMVSAISLIVARHGIDPRRFLLVVAGGAGPTHAVWLAKEMNMKWVLMPKAAGNFCAIGMMNADLRFDNLQSYYTESLKFDVKTVNKILEGLETRGRLSLDAAEAPESKRIFEYSAEARYPGQIHTLSVPLPDSRLRDDTLPQLMKNFHDIHEKRYMTAERDCYIEFQNWRVAATCITSKVSFKDQPLGSEDPSKALKGYRKVYFTESLGFMNTPVYDGNKLTYGNKIEGPAIIEEFTCTPVIPPDTSIVVTKWGDYYMELP